MHVSVWTGRYHASAPESSGKNIHVELKYSTDDRTKPQSGGSKVVLDWGVLS